jgi:hypothetical protein
MTSYPVVQLLGSTAIGRIIVAICHNMDLGDAWECADKPRYLEKCTSAWSLVRFREVAFSKSSEVA